MDNANLNSLMGDQGRVDLLAMVVGNADPEKSCVLDPGAVIGGWGISCTHVLPSRCEYDV